MAAALRVGIRLITGYQRSAGGFFSPLALLLWGVIFLLAAFLPPRSLPARHSRFFVGANLALSAGAFGMAYARWRGETR